MNNKLTLWYEPSREDRIKAEIKAEIQKHYSFADSEFEPVENGFRFLFDDETNGEIEVTFTKEPNITSLKVTVEVTWSWEVMEIYNLLPQYPGEGGQ